MVSHILPASHTESEKLPLSSVLLPQIQQYLHTASDDFPSAFTELSFRNEGFRSQALVAESPVLHQALLETPSTTQGEWR